MPIAAELQVKFLLSDDFERCAFGLNNFNIVQWFECTVSGTIVLYCVNADD